MATPTATAADTAPAQDAEPAPEGNPATAPSGAKDLPLEALRGLAAINVLLWHLLLGFFPPLTGFFPQIPAALGGSLDGMPFFGLVYGFAAVTLFFVLSGFVLTRRYLVCGDGALILRGAVKRWPRLVGPVLVTVMISWALFKLRLYRFEEGGALVGSPWLMTFAGALEEPFRPHFWDALRQGAYRTFIQGDAYYNSSLWTMRFEFIGSFAAFGLALVLWRMRAAALALQILIVAVTAAVGARASPFFVAFPVGVALAAAMPRRRALLPAWAVASLIVVAIYLFGFSGAQKGAYADLARLVGHLSPIYLHIAAAVLLIVAVELAPAAFRAPLSGPWARRLGALSFPLYLIHVPVICSFGCAVLIWTATLPGGPYPALAAALSIPAAIMAALPLMAFNERWVVFVNRAADWTLRRLAFRVGPRLTGAPQRSGAA